MTKYVNTEMPDIEFDTMAKAQQNTRVQKIDLE